MSDSLNDALAALERLTGYPPKKSSNGWQAKCPCHDDSTASLAVSVGSKQAVLVHCHAGCDPKKILATLGLNNSPSGKRIVATYEYRDSTGNRLFDDPGRQHAALVKQSLPQARGLELPGLPPKGDVSDWLDAGHTKADLLALVDRLPAVDAATDAPLPLALNVHGKPFSTLANTTVILTQHPDWRGVFGYDQFAEQAVIIRRPPYPQREWKPGAVSDVDEFRARVWLQKNIGINPTASDVGAAIQMAAHDAPFHPVRQYLGSLQWDGIARLDTWIIRHLGADNTDYVRAVSSKWLISAVARILEPGCKADSALVLIGEQGIGKSTALRTLFSDDWFSDCMPDLHSKDAMHGLAGKWLIELAELSALGRSETEAAKRFMAAVQDTFRPAYGRRSKTFLRQCIFAGTTNTDTFLQDETGNRRWWCVPVTAPASIGDLAAERDLLFAEAVARYRRGERWHLTGIAAQQAEAAAADHVRRDAWESAINPYLESRQDVSVAEVLEQALGMTASDWRQPDQNRVARVLRLRGWIRYKRRDGTTREWRYRREKVPVVPVSSEFGPSMPSAENPATTWLGPSGPSGPSKDKHNASKSDTGPDATPAAVVLPMDSIGNSGTTGTTGTKAFKTTACEKPLLGPLGPNWDQTGTRLGPPTEPPWPATEAERLALRCADGFSEPTDNRDCSTCGAYARLAQTCGRLASYIPDAQQPLCGGKDWRPADGGE